MRKLLLINIFLTASIAVTMAQNKAVAKIDTTQITIGDQTALFLYFESKNLQNVLFPQFCDTCITGIEVVEKQEIDTAQNPKTGIYTLSQKIIITSFDSGSYVIPAFSFFTTDSTLLASTDSILLAVQTIVVDTATAFKDIKPPLTVPFTWQEIVPYVISAIALVTLIVGIIFLVRYLRKKSKKGIKSAPKIQLPAHVIALNALKMLNAEKLPEKGFNKMYYSKLSDILRNYIFNRWAINAMEMVSDEIMDTIKLQHISSQNLENLDNILRYADLVKFAKKEPVTHLITRHYENAIEFVESTKKTEEISQKENNNPILEK
ncbi:MAG: hypothetical protein LBR36_03220 [Bacteroidales bacterium]|jgi:hypothetical protein|nr:hypothetical protein [Bacteroidales bacterium]